MHHNTWLVSQIQLLFSSVDLWFLFWRFSLMCVSVLLPCMYACVPRAPMGARRGHQIPLALELETIVSYDVSVWNWTSELSLQPWVLVFLYVSVYICHVYAGAHRGPGRASDPLELELQEALSYPGWVLSLKLRTSGRTANSPRCRAFSPVPLLPHHQHTLGLWRKTCDIRQSFL